MMLRSVGIIGAGHAGAALARLCVAVEINVIVANSRGPESLQQLVGELGGAATARTLDQVGDGADLVVAAVPFGVHRALPADALAGKIVVDMMNYFPQRDGRLKDLDDRLQTQSQLVQRHLPGTEVVKALNNIDFLRLPVLSRPAGHPERSALPVAGDSVAAKNMVAGFIDAIGFDPLDIGGLSESWRMEPNAPAYVEPYFQVSDHYEDFYSRLINARAVPAARQTIRELTGAAVPGVVGIHL